MKTVSPINRSQESSEGIVQRLDTAILTVILLYDSPTRFPTYSLARFAANVIISRTSGHSILHLLFHLLLRFL